MQRQETALVQTLVQVRIIVPARAPAGWAQEDLTLLQDLQTSGSEKGVPGPWPRLAPVNSACG